MRGDDLHAPALVGLGGDDIGKILAPAGGLGVPQQGYDGGFLGLVEEGGELIYGAGEHFLSGGAGVYALDGQHASEDLVHDRAVVVHDGPVLSHDQGGNAPAVGGSEDGPHVLRVDGGAGYRLSAYGAYRAVDGDVAVDEVQDGVEVVDQRGGPSGGDEYPHSGLMRRGQCPDRGCRHRMGPEADQCPVYVEKQSFYHKTF